MPGAGHFAPAIVLSVWCIFCSHGILLRWGSEGLGRRIFYSVLRPFFPFLHVSSPAIPDYACDSMIFADFYKGPRSPLAKLRHHQTAAPQQAHSPPSNGPDWTAEAHADLLSRDKTKVKEAVKKYLATKVRNDWEFEWPPPTPTRREAKPEGSSPPKLEAPGPGSPAQVQDELIDDDGYQNDDTVDDEPSDDCDDDDDDGQDNRDAVSIYSVVSEDPTHYKALLDWDSDIPVDDPMSPTSHDTGMDFGNDPVSKLERQARRRREQRKEMEYNEGLACFEARRAAWTQARTVRVRVKPENPPPSASQHSPRRFFFRRSVSSPMASHDARSTNSPTATTSSSSDGTAERDGDKESHKHLKKDSTSQTSQHSDASLYPVETIVPVPAPILPPSNPLRASIQPSHYLQLYDKLIVNNLTPSCPINLSDMLPACVAGWKRDGEWPPRPALPVDPGMAAYGARKKKRSSFGTQDHANSPSGRRLSLTTLLSRDKGSESHPTKSVRQSLSKAFGLGSHAEVSVAKQTTNT